MNDRRQRTSTPGRVPIAVTCSVLIAIACHLGAAIGGLRRWHWIGPLDWTALALAEVLLLFVALARPDAFRLRTFRLPAVLVVSSEIIILAPLPGIVRQYEAQVPRSAVLSIAAGVAVTALLLAIPDRARRPTNAPVTNKGSRKLVLAIGAAGVVIFPIWLRSLASVPLLALLTGHSSGIDLAVQRDQALMGLGALPLRLAVGMLRNLYLMFAVAWLVGDWVLTPRREWRRRAARRIAAALVAGVSVLYALVTTERAILGQVVLVCVVAALVALRRPLAPRLIAVVTPLVLGFPLLFGLLVSGSAGGAVESVRRRSLFLPGDVMIHYFTAFPTHHGFLHGRSVPKISRLAGLDTFDLSKFVYDTYYRVDANLEGIANGSYLGVGWANFGPFGVILWAALAAGAIVLIERALRRLPIRTAAALRAVAVIQVGVLTSVDVFRSVLGFAPGFLDLVALSWLLAWFQRKRAFGTHGTGRVAGGAHSPAGFGESALAGKRFA